MSKKLHPNILKALERSHRNSHIKSLRNYYKNPNRCTLCNKIIRVVKKVQLARKKKFCSHTCSAIVNNRKRKRKRTDRCLNCKEILKSRQIKYCSVSCMWALRRKIRYKILLKGGSETSVKIVKQFLAINIGKFCVLCQRKTWKGNPIPLILDHIDGNPMNNNISNLRLICPNCDALLPTFTGRNRGKGRKSRRLFYKKNGYC
jgi:hypothetical protein